MLDLDSDVLLAPESDSLANASLIIGNVTDFGTRILKTNSVFSSVDFSANLGLLTSQ